MKAIYIAEQETNRDPDLVTIEESEKVIDSIDELVKSIETFKKDHPNAVIDGDGVELALIDYNETTKIYYQIIFKNEA